VSWGVETLIRLIRALTVYEDTLCSVRPTSSRAPAPLELWEEEEEEEEEAQQP